MSAINLSPATRFLLRGSVLVAILLALWWLVPFNPLLFVLRKTVGFSGSFLFAGSAAFTVTEADNGDWTFQVPLEATLPRTDVNAAPQQINSIDFDLARSDEGAFTFGLPVFWAVVLAAGNVRRNLRAMLLGTLAMGVVEIALVLITAEILARKSLAQMLQSHDPLQAWLLKFSEYLAVNAIPYLLPFAVAIWLHPELRGQILYRSAPVAVADPPIPVRQKSGRRVKSRRMR